MKLSTIWIIGLLLAGFSARSQDWKALALPTTGAKWVQPAQGTPALPIWGHVQGIQVGIAPLPGPRGLLRIYTPYLGHEPWNEMNFIAFEPIVEGQKMRGLSELEPSKLDEKRGKRFWSANDSLQTNPVSETLPASGIIEKINGEETLTIFIFSEAFDNGAKVYCRLRFYERRPYEIEISTHKTPESAALSHFIVTATMGNYARLRKLFLKPGVKESGAIWPQYTGDGFTAHARFPASDLLTDRAGQLYFLAAPDEKEPGQATYAPNTKNHWKYYGKKATQYWYTPGNIKGVEGLVNGRYMYWASQSPIPGGISFENFELNSPYEEGACFVFGVSPLKPEKLIRKLGRGGHRSGQKK